MAARSKYSRSFDHRARKQLTSACCRTGFPLRSKPAPNAGVRRKESEHRSDEQKDLQIHGSRGSEIGLLE